jgi:hypothetical protein
MRYLTVPLFAFAVVLLLGAAALAHTDDKTFTVDPITFPDGNVGVAVVVVKTVDHAPVVIVDYYNMDRSQHLGRYEDYSGGDVPTAEDSARDFAFNHYFERW